MKLTCCIFLVPTPLYICMYISSILHSWAWKSKRNMGIFIKKCSLLLFLALLFSLKISTLLSCKAESDPIDGFIPVPLTEYNFKLQKPYDTPLEERYNFINGTRSLWVYADDKPHDPNSRTQPRTEVRIQVRN